MNLTLAPEVEAMIERRIRSGEFGSPEAVVTAALLSFQDDESTGHFAPGELDALVAEGERGEKLDGLAVLDEFRKWRADASRR